MRVLAFDTSRDILSVAVMEDTRLLAESRPAAGARHSDQLVPFIEKTLKKAKCPPARLDGIAVGLGPGSFTGLRVGAVTARILSFVWKKKLAGVSSLEALARSLPRPAHPRIALALDARRGKVYAALYERTSAGFRTCIGPVLTEPAGFFAALPKAVTVLSDLEGLRTHLPKDRGHAYVDLRGAALLPAARGVAEAALAARRWKMNARIEPFYLYPKDCNVTKKKSP